MNILHLCKNLNNLSYDTSPKNLLSLRKELGSLARSRNPLVPGYPARLSLHPNVRAVCIYECGYFLKVSYQRLRKSSR